MDDAIIRGRAEHGEEGTDAPVGRGRPLVLLPIHLKTGSRSRAGEADTSLSLVKPEQSRRSRYFIKPVLFRPIILIPTAIIPTGEYLLKTSEGRPSGRAGAGQHGTSRPGVLAQHSKIRSAVSTWQLAMLT